MSFQVLISLFAILVCVSLISVMAYKGVSPFLPVLAGVVLVCVCSGLSAVKVISNEYLIGMANVFKGMFLYYTMGTFLGKGMVEAGFAHSLAYFLSDKLGAVGHKFPAAVILTISMILGGTGMFVGVVPLVYPIAIIMLSKENYSVDVLAGAVFCGIGTLTYFCPMLPSAPNSILPGLFGVESVSTAGLVPGFAAAAFQFLASCVFLEVQGKYWRKKGRTFDQWEYLPEDSAEFRASLPSPLIAALPIVAVLVFYNVFSIPVSLSLALGGVCAVALAFKKHSLNEWIVLMTKGAYEGIIPAANVSIVGGIGTVVVATPFYSWGLAQLSQIEINPYLLAFLGVTIVAGLIGSGTSAIVTVVPCISEVISKSVALGYDLGNIARIMPIGAITLDSLPHNGAVMAVCQMMHTTVRRSYWCIFITSTVIPFFTGFLVALPLMMLGFK